MKLSVLAAIAASAVYTSAAPLRVVVVSTNVIQGPNDSPLAHMRFGHAVPSSEDQVGRIFFPAQAPPHAHRPCAGRMFRMKQKGVEIANKFRDMFGLPLIEVPHHGHGHKHHDKVPSEFKILPFMGAPTPITVGHYNPNSQGWEGMTKGGDKVHIVGNILPHSAPAFGPEGNEQSHPHAHHHHRHDSFMFRMQTALLSLGPWEGRAVAFVLGCGIGVLLRMLWVLGVVGYRSIHSDDYEYSHVEDMDDDENVVRSAPPVYVYPVDEKIAVETDTQPAENAAKANDVAK